MTYKIGDTVSVDSKDGNPTFPFVGTIITIIKETDEYLVRDQDDDVFIVDHDQLGDDYFDGIDSL
jgi:hypothetical protein